MNSQNQNNLYDIVPPETIENLDSNLSELDEFLRIDNTKLFGTDIGANTSHQEEQPNVATTLCYQFASSNDQPSTPFTVINQPDGGTGYYLNSALPGNSQSVTNQNSALEVEMVVQNEAIQISLDGRRHSPGIFNQLPPQNFENWNQVEWFENATPCPQFNIGSSSHEDININDILHHLNNTAESSNSNITNDIQQHTVLNWSPSQFDYDLLKKASSSPSDEVYTSSLHNSSAINEVIDTPSDAFDLIDFINSSTKDNPSNTNEALQSQLLSNSCTSLSHENVTSDVNNGINNNIQRQAPIESHQSHNLVSSSGLNAELEVVPMQAQKFKKLNSPPRVMAIVNTTEIDQFDRQSSAKEQRRKTRLRPRQHDDSDICIDNIKPATNMIYNVGSEVKINSEASTSNLDESNTDSISDTFVEATLSIKQTSAKKIRPKKKSIKRQVKIVQSNAKRQLRSSRAPAQSYKEDSEEDDDKKLKPIVDQNVINGVKEISLTSPQPALLEESSVNCKEPQNIIEEVNQIGKNEQPMQENQNGNTADGKNFQKVFEDFAKNFKSNRY